MTARSLTELAGRKIAEVRPAGWRPAEWRIDATTLCKLRLEYDGAAAALAFSQSGVESFMGLPLQINQAPAHLELVCYHGQGGRQGIFPILSVD